MDQEMTKSKSDMTKSIKLLLMAIGVAGALASGTASAQKSKNLPDVQYYGYKIVHHMAAVIKHIETFGFNKFDHPRIADYRSFVITPALDHLYSKAVVDVRFGPVVVDTPAHDGRYVSLEIFDFEHFAIYDKVLSKMGERFVLVHEDHKGKMPKGTVIRTKSNFAFVFVRTQSFAFNNDKLAESIRRQVLASGAFEPIALPNTKDTIALIRWTIANSKPYAATKALMARAAKIYTPMVHKQTFEFLKAFVAGGGLVSNRGMFEPQGHPAGGSHKARAAGTLLGHLGFPVHHAYYQQVPVDRKGRRLAGANGPFVVTVPHKPGVKLFWSVTRYGANTFLPLNPADLGGRDIQAYNQFNTKPDANGNVTITFSMKNPNDGTYWMPVSKSGYYTIFRYYGPTPKLNGRTAADLVYKGTALEKRFKAVKF
jgi:hypothetical protein